jgi:hypothetical protein
LSKPDKIVVNIKDRKLKGRYYLLHFKPDKNCVLQGEGIGFNAL